VEFFHFAEEEFGLFAVALADGFVRGGGFFFAFFARRGGAAFFGFFAAGGRAFTAGAAARRATTSGDGESHYGHESQGHGRPPPQDFADFHSFPSRDTRNRTRVRLPNSLHNDDARVKQSSLSAARRASSEACRSGRKPPKTGVRRRGRCRAGCGDRLRSPRALPAARAPFSCARRPSRPGGRGSRR